MAKGDFQKIVDNNADAMIVVDKQGVIRYVNPAGLKLFNLPENEMVGQLLGSPIVLHEPVDMYVLRKFRDFIAVEMRMVNVDWKGKPSYLISLRDVTWRVRYEEELSRSRDKLEVLIAERTAQLVEMNLKLKEEIEAKNAIEEELRVEVEEHRSSEEELRVEIEQREKMELSLAESARQAEFYLDLMSHDIRNLNQIGIGYLELALEATDLAEAKELMNKPLEAMVSTSQLIDNVKKLKDLTVGNLKTNKLESINLCETVKELKNKYWNINGRDIVISTAMPRICFISANDLIKDVFSNLPTSPTRHSIVCYERMKISAFLPPMKSRTDSI